MAHTDTSNNKGKIIGDTIIGKQIINHSYSKEEHKNIHNEIKDKKSNTGKTFWDIISQPLVLGALIILLIITILLALLGEIEIGYKNGFLFKIGSVTEAKASSSAQIPKLSKTVTKEDIKKALILENYLSSESLKTQLTTYLNTLNWADIENDAIINMWVSKKNPLIFMDSINIELPRFINYCANSDEICEPLNDLTVQQNIKKLLPDDAFGLEFKVKILAGGKLASQNPVFDLHIYKWGIN